MKTKISPSLVGFFVLGAFALAVVGGRPLAAQDEIPQIRGAVAGKVKSATSTSSCS